MSVLSVMQLVFSSCVLLERTNGGPMRGVGLAYHECNDLPALDVSWFYTWTAYSPCPDVVDPPFVPMIFNASYMNYVATVNQTKGVEYLLGFNEPDYDNQANMDVSTAIELWPQLMETGLKLGSPSATQYVESDRNGPLWLKQFMGNVTKLGYRVDFICIHYYMRDNQLPQYSTINDLRNFLNNIRISYPGYKVWLTEFNNQSGNVTENIGYFQDAYSLITSEFEDLVERYSWFTNRWQNWKYNQETYLNSIDNGELTRLGRVYSSYPK